MRLYEGTISQFNNDVLQNRIAEIVANNYLSYYGKRVTPSEKNSWHISLNFVKNALDISKLHDNKIVVEYELPYSSRRIDVLLFGKDKKEQSNVVLIELKQWSNDNIEDCETEGNVIVNYGKHRVERAHPSLQVEGYHYHLMDFITLFEEKQPTELSSCAYCHNYSKTKNPTLYLSKFSKYIEKYPLFSKEEIADLGKYLAERLNSGSGLEVFNRFITSPIKPSKRLLDHTKKMINEQQIFNLIDDQIVAYNAIMHKAKKLAKTKKKSVIIVKGGPGTGKSVIALEVMGELMRMGKIVFHATGSSAFTNTLRQILGRRVKDFFKFFFSFTNHKDDEIDVLICDEAHRIRKDSSDWGVPYQYKSKEPQVEDLIRPAKLSLFFIDEYQVVRPKEIGSVALIKKAAKKFEIEEPDIVEFELRTQFRCNGSDAYLQWLENILHIRESDKQFLTQDDRMDFRIIDSPLELKKVIDEKNREKKNCARLVAGFCWPWSKPNPDGSLVNDVKIGNLEMPWEKKDQFWRWATDDSGMEQVGTVYTAQGFEFDYIGVFFGNDLVYDIKKRKWVGKPENSYDSVTKRDASRFTEHLKNVYRVLMSRAHKGCYVYFMDKDAEQYFKSHIKELGSKKILDESSIDKILEDIEENAKFKTHLPLVPLEAVATAFTKEDYFDSTEGWIEADIARKLSDDMFIAKIVGKSMEPKIKDGSYCVFRFDPGGTREGKIVLANCTSIADPESKGQYTIKKYHSEKEYFEDGSWKHKKIVLSPLNKKFEDIILEDKTEGDFRIVAEFICVIAQGKR
jgi:hypothetical protein